ncbi:MAG: TCR/Tet family transporter [Labilithrix sp.]|nr:TCR/Tet family transporter [Labilithrix sp.]
MAGDRRRAGDLRAHRSPLITPPGRNPVSFLLILLFLDALGIGALLPVLPRLLSSLAGGNGGARFYGAFVAAYAAMQLVFAPILGALSDRFGRRPVILGSLLGAGLDYVLLAVAPSLAWLAVGRIVAGATGASFSAATAYIVDVTPVERRAQTFGLMGGAFGLGFVVGPALGGLTGSINLRGPFVLAAVLNAANFVYGLVVLPESLAREHRRAFSLRRANPVTALRMLVRRISVRRMAGVATCCFFAQQIMQSVWALHTEMRLGWSPLDIGLSLAVVGILGIVVQAWVVRLVVPRLGEARTVVVGLVLNALGFVGFAVTSSAIAVYALIVLFSLGGVAAPALQSMLSAQVGPSEQGELQGSLGAVSSLTAIIGPLVAVGLFARLEPSLARPHVPGAAFLLGALTCALGIAMARRLVARVGA